LSVLLAEHPFSPGDPLVTSESGTLTLGDLRARVDALAGTLRAAGQAVGNLVLPGPSSLVVMFATWAAGGVYAPVNARYTAEEVASIADETRLALLVGTPADLDGHPVENAGLVSYQHALAASAVLRPALAGAPGYPADVAVITRTSGTTGKPKAVPLRHSGTLDAVDASMTSSRWCCPRRCSPCSRMTRRSPACRRCAWSGRSRRRSRLRWRGSSTRSSASWC
jgi:acyl-CoA synthetase (AMP-forming)/AMP-acid ligase II